MWNVGDYLEELRFRHARLSKKGKTFEGLESTIAALELLPAETDYKIAKLTGNRHGWAVLVNGGKECAGIIVTHGPNPDARLSFEIASGQRKATPEELAAMESSAA